MWTITEMKEKGKQAFKQNYWRSVFAAILLTLLLGGYATAQTRNSHDTIEDKKNEQTITQAIDELSQSEKKELAIALMTGLAIISVLSFVLKIFVFNPLEVGCHCFFKRNVEGQETKLGTLKEGFGAYGHTFATLFLRDLFLALWSLLFFIPGLIKFYSYRMVPYIIKDHPELSATEVITHSCEMMQGNKARAFLLDLSFLGWFLLGTLTVGITNIFWTEPYYYNTRAALYLELKD